MSFQRHKLNTATTVLGFRSTLRPEGKSVDENRLTEAQAQGLFSQHRRSPVSSDSLDIQFAHVEPLTKATAAIQAKMSISTYMQIAHGVILNIK